MALRVANTGESSCREPHPANWPRPKLAMNQCGACLPSNTRRLCLTFRCSPERLGRVLPNLHARDYGLMYSSLGCSPSTLSTTSEKSSWRNIGRSILEQLALTDRSPRNFRYQTGISRVESRPFNTQVRQLGNQAVRKASTRAS